MSTTSTFEKAFDKIKLRYNAELDTDVPTAGMIKLCKAYREVYRRHVGESFPAGPD